MGYTIDRVAIVGAGVMGGGIAALLANAGLSVYLLDIVPNGLSPEEEAKGLTLNSPEVRNRIVMAGLNRVLKARPPALFTPENAGRIKVGNLDDNLDWAGQADWIVEAVVEDLDVKREIMGRIEEARKPGSIVSTNTSGISIAAVAKGCSAEFKAHFLGTHFFNPPRHMKLLEIIPHADTDSEVVEFMTEFGERVLGKGVVVCKDTPNFIANRLGIIAAWHDIDYALQHNYTVEEVDAITGPLIGRPKTATFRLRDLIGLDVSARVAANLYDTIPHDTYRHILKGPRVVALWEKMLTRGWLGTKSGQGFYRRVETEKGRQFWALDLKASKYHEPSKVDLSTVTEALKIANLEERLRFLVSADDRVGNFVWAILSNLLCYSAACIPEIADNVTVVDRAVRWGFGHQLGPFEIWDALGVGEVCARLEREGQEVSAWVREMLPSGHLGFYHKEKGKRYFYSRPSRAYQAIPPDQRVIILKDLRNEGRIVLENSGASLIDMGDGVACLEFHTKGNAMTDELRAMLELSLEEVDRHFDGLVIGNQGAHFCAGADLGVYLQLFSEAAETGDYTAIEKKIELIQARRMAYRFFHKPVVAVPFKMTLGGGAELIMSVSAVCAAAESYIGLVETAVGLVPGGCGCKEMVRRVVSPPMRTPNVDALPFLQKAFDNIAWAKTSSSAEEARQMGFLADSDRIVMNHDHLLSEAKRMVLEIVRAGHRPPPREKTIYAVGERGLANLRVDIYLRGEEGAASEFDMKLAEKVAYVLCGGNLSYPQWVDEQYILDLEREAFLSLAGEPKTVERIKHMLSAGKRLRN